MSSFLEKAVKPDLKTENSILIDPAADELAHQRVGGDQALVDVAEELQRGQHLPQLLIAIDALGHGGEELRGRSIEERRCCKASGSEGS